MKSNNYIFKCVLTNLTLLFFTCHITSQVNPEIKFLKYFYAQSLAGKIKAFDTLHSDFKGNFYPLVKEELKKIREQAILDKQDEILGLLPVYQ